MRESGEMVARNHPLVQRLKGLPPPLGTVAAATVFAAALVGLFLVLLQLPNFGDWHFFYDVARSPRQPYAVPGFFNAPWLAWLLAPFSLLPQHLGGAVWMTLSVIGALWSIHRLQGGILAASLSLLSPAFIRFITAGQVDVLPLVGFVLMLTADALPVMGLGIVLAAIKPQTFGGGALTWWTGLKREERWRVFWPFVAVLALSFAIHGFWPAQIRWQHLNHSVDASPWPYGIPLGLALLGYAIRRQEPAVGAFSTLFLTPYISPSSLFVYTVLLFSRAPRWLSISTFALLWIYALTIS